MGLSRDTFYRYQELVETNGLDAPINQNRRVPNLKNWAREQRYFFNHRHLSYFKCLKFNR